MNDKYVEGLCRVLQRTGETTGGVSNPGVEVSAMDEENLQGMIYYIKYFKKNGCTWIHADVDLEKDHTIYNHRDMKEAHKDPEVVPNVDPKDRPKTL